MIVNYIHLYEYYIFLITFLHTFMLKNVPLDEELNFNKVKIKRKQ